MVKIDNDLLFIKSENARISLKDLSGLLKKSPQRLKYSIMRLEKEYLGEPYCIFDYSRFGQLLFRVYFKAGYIGDTDKALIISTLNKNLHVMSVYELTGGFDLVVEFAAPNPSRFNKELKKVARLPTLSAYKIILNLVTYLFPREYFSENVGYVEKIIGGDREVEQFSENEKAVIKQLLTNPLARMTYLSKLTGLNVRTVKTIMQNLVARNVVRGYKHLIDTEKLGINKVRVFIKLHNLSTKRENDLMEYLSVQKHVVQVNKTVGDWDLELDIESEDSMRSRSLIMMLRKEFKDIIESFNLIEFFKYYKRSYLPACLFSPKD